MESQASATADKDVPAIAKTIHIDLDGIGEIAVDQYRRFAGNNHGLFHIAIKASITVDDFHRPAAEHIGRTNNHRVADTGDNFLGLTNRTGNAVFRLFELQINQQFLKPVAIFGQINRIR